MGISYGFHLRQHFKERVEQLRVELAATLRWMTVPAESTCGRSHMIMVPQPFLFVYNQLFLGIELVPDPRDVVPVRPTRCSLRVLRRAQSHRAHPLFVMFQT